MVYEGYMRIPEGPYLGPMVSIIDVYCLHWRSKVNESLNSNHWLSDGICEDLPNTHCGANAAANPIPADRRVHDSYHHRCHWAAVEEDC